MALIRLNQQKGIMILQRNEYNISCESSARDSEKYLD